MKLNLKGLSGHFRQGIILEQHKEPTLSQEIEKLITPGKVQVIRELEQPWNDIAEISPGEIVQVARLARIVDERDGLPLFRKLKLCAGRQAALRVDAMDDEPYISSQLGPLLHMSRECAGGLALAAKAVGAVSQEILVYGALTDLETRVPKTLDGVPVRRILGRYPGKPLSAQSLVEENGQVTLYVGACALIHLYRAVYEGIKQTTAFLTVAGNCVSAPCNMEVSLGTTATEILDRCGLEAEPTRVVVGGSVTGISVADTDEVKVGAATRAILALREDERDKKYRCVGCGRCVEACPMDLNPMLLYKTINMNLHSRAEQLDYKMCISCMCCSYVCPAKLDLAGRISWYRRSRKEGGRP